MCEPPCPAQYGDDSDTEEHTTADVELHRHPSPDDLATEKHLSSRRSSTEHTSSTSTTATSCLEARIPFASVSSRPHKAHDAGWDAIRSVTSTDRDLGLRHFRLLQKLGSGDIGSVYLTELRQSGGCLFAMKVMDKQALEARKKLSRAQTEREILQVLDHPFLPTLYSHIDDGQYSCLVMEFCPGGDLHVLRQRQPMKRFNDRAVRFYAAEVLLALEYLHMMGIVYRDLKPENVLVREDGHIMLSDFDLSMKCSVNPTLARVVATDERNGGASPPPCAAACAGASAAASCILPLGCVSPCSMHPVASCLPMPRLLNFPGIRRRQKPRRSSGNGRVNSLGLPELHAEPTSARSMSFVGTHEYLAPEIILGDGHGSAVDWWTFGIFMFELFYGRTPFKGADHDVTLTNVVTQLLRFPSDDEFLQAPPPVAAQDLIRGLLIKDPNKRLAALRGASEIKQNAFFNGVNWALIRCAVPPEIPSPFTPPEPPSISVGKSGGPGGVLTDDAADDIAKAWFLRDSPSADCNIPDYELF